MPPYRYTLTDRAFQAFAVCDDDEARQLLLAIEMLARDPDRRPSCIGSDSEGRTIPWIEAGPLLIGYFVDHPAKHVFILDVRRIDF